MCEKCNGLGLPEYRHIDNGICWDCGATPTKKAIDKSWEGKLEQLGNKLREIESQILEKEKSKKNYEDLKIEQDDQEGIEYCNRWINKHSKKINDLKNDSNKITLNMKSMWEELEASR